jgi:outer membrane biosynthesis protein TonB
MAEPKLTDKSKEMLKRFLTFNFEEDYENPEAKEKFSDMFRKMLMTDDPGMKAVVKSMFDSFAQYNNDEKVIGNEEKPAEEAPVEEPVPEDVPEEMPAEEPAPEEMPQEEPPADEAAPTEDNEDENSIFGESYGFNLAQLEKINDWLEG